MSITRLNPESVAISEQNPITAAEMGNTGVADGCWYLRAVDQKTGHQYGLIPRASGLLLYDDTARATVWNIEPLSVLIKSTTTNVTVANGGYISLGLQIPNYVVAVRAGNASGMLNARIIPYNHNGRWYAIVLSNTSSLAYLPSGTTGQVTIYYV